MDFATLLGMLFALGAIIAGNILEGGNPMVLLFLPAIVLVIGGALGVGLASNRLSDMSGIIKATVAVLKPGKGFDGPATINQLMAFAETARQDGLLALEEQVKAVEDPFLRRGLELVVDGTDSDEVADALGQEVEAQRERHKVAAKYFADMGAYAPTIGIIGTVMGLAHALEKLDDPSKLGHSIAAALMATLWGVMSANVFFLPIAAKMRRLSALESAHRALMIEGVLAIQAGASPRALAERLKSHLPPKERDKVGAKAEEKVDA